MVELAELLDSIPPARGRKSKLSASKRRDLVASDIAALSTARPLEQVSPIGQLRHQHHLAARLLAEGRQLVETAEITGYSVSYLSRLQTQDSAFKDLIQYYKEQVGEIYVDVHQRLANLGINTVEELQDRLAEHPEKFSSRELMELAELCLDRGGYAPEQHSKHTLAILTAEDISRLKGEVARRQNGTVRQISSSDKGSPVGGAVLDLSVSKSPSEGASSQGNDVPAESRPVAEEEHRE